MMRSTDSAVHLATEEDLCQDLYPPELRVLPLNVHKLFLPSLLVLLYGHLEYLQITRHSRLPLKKLRK
jgi:hypothetical protein